MVHARVPRDGNRCEREHRNGYTRAGLVLGLEVSVESDGRRYPDAGSQLVNNIPLHVHCIFWFEIWVEGYVCLDDNDLLEVVGLYLDL